MNKARIIRRIPAYIFVLLLAFPYSAMAQEITATAPEENTQQVFRPEELDQMLAPIALYPDALLAQVLTAATYPLDIVSADRFVKEHPGINGQALVEAAQDQDWEPSVKAMLQFPDVLAMMDNQLQWTTKLGDAFISQQREVMDSVQRLRQKAYTQGKLATTPEQVVTVDPQSQIVVIEPPSPEVVYVPVYDPLDVYGVWWYPDYPPFRCYYPGFVGGFYLPGFFVNIGFGWGSWDCDWYRHHVNIIVNNFNAFTARSFARHDRFHIEAAGRHSVAWQHDPGFSRTAGHRDYWTAQHLGGRQISNTTVRPSASEFRGFEQNQTNVRTPTGRTETPAVVRPSVSRERTSGGTKVQRETVQPNGLPARRTEVPKVIVPTENVFKAGAERQQVIRPSLPQITPPRESSNIFSGVGRGDQERAASFRGQSSLQGIRPSGGFSESHGSRPTSSESGIRGSETRGTAGAVHSGGGGESHFGGGGNRDNRR